MTKDSISPINCLLGRALQWSGNPYGNGYGVEMEWKWGTICGNRMDWIGFGQSVDIKLYDDIEPSQNTIKVTQKQGYI